MERNKDVVWIHGYDGVRVGAVGREIIEITRTKKVTFEEFLEFKMLASSPKAALLREDVEIDYKGVRYFIHEIKETGATSQFLEIYANAAWYRLGERKYIGSLLLDSVSAAGGLSAILQGSGWEGIYTDDPKNLTYSMEMQDKTYLQLLRAWANITGLYLDFDTSNWLNNNNRGVLLVGSLGQDLGTAFRKGRNIRDYTRTRIGPQITRMFPYGADDLNIAGINGGAEYIEDFSFYTSRGVSIEDARLNHTKDAQYVDSSIVNENDLLRVGQAKLAEQNDVINYVELDVIDVSELIGLNDEYKVWDRVRLVHEDFGLDERVTIVSTIHHDRQPWLNQIELDTKPDLTVDDLGDNSRELQSAEWRQFVGPVAANFIIRNDGSWTVARIPLRFREGGRTHWFLDFDVEGVGSGVATIQMYDATDEVAIRSWTTPYSNGSVTRVFGMFAVEELNGSHDYRLRVSVAGSGGPSISNGVNLYLQVVEESDLISWYVMAQGAVQETPPAGLNSQTFNYTGTVQYFTVPDNITQVTINVKGAAGGGNSETTGSGQGNPGGTTEATFGVTPGEVLEVIVGGRGSAAANGRTFGGGGAGGGFSGNRSPSGGGLSAVVRGWLDTATPLGAIMILAAGGGGRTGGGVGGFFRGGDDTETNGGLTPATGATQYSGGTGAFVGANAGSDGSYLSGGNAVPSTSAFGGVGGGGGGGIYGGGGGANSFGGFGLYDGGGGGGGAGWLSSDAADPIISDGTGPQDHGVVVISWGDPVNFPE